MLGPKTKFGTMFVMHQAVAQWAVPVSVPILLGSALTLLHRLGMQGYAKDYRWLLNGTAYFPAHATLALTLGLLLSIVVRDRSSLWVWTVPAVFMAHALLFQPSLRI